MSVYQGGNHAQDPGRSSGRASGLGFGQPDLGSARQDERCESEPDPRVRQAGPDARTDFLSRKGERRSASSSLDGNVWSIAEGEATSGDPHLDVMVTAAAISVLRGE